MTQGRDTNPVMSVAERLQMIAATLQRECPPLANAEMEAVASLERWRPFRKSGHETTNKVCEYARMELMTQVRGTNADLYTNLTKRKPAKGKPKK